MFVNYLYDHLMEMAGGDLNYAKELLDELTMMVNQSIEQEEGEEYGKN